ncbi:DUF2877 domain-containing protein [Saxibacter everestensis]|uniref:DUF2877 domain-containing protein n=1 Tax=Saxibacter everestensis TaxID=2909229 RepID=A0ABY8QW51_9MICO|nr:DUF2877 domain-containing protein [Brevibacteriaceae bacterium ZFBP1038]
MDTLPVDCADSVPAAFSSRLRQLVDRQASARVVVTSRNAAYARTAGREVFAIVNGRAYPPSKSIVLPGSADVSMLYPAGTRVRFVPSAESDGVAGAGMVGGGFAGAGWVNGSNGRPGSGLFSSMVRVDSWWQPQSIRRGDVDQRAADRLRRLVDARAPEFCLAGFESAALDIVRRQIGIAADYWASGHVDGCRSALLTLLGLGPGSTPAGDDAVAGFLLGLRAFAASPASPASPTCEAHPASSTYPTYDAHPVCPVGGTSVLGSTPATHVMRASTSGAAGATKPSVISPFDSLGAEVAEAAADRTTIVSAGLLHEASQGYCAPELIRAVETLTAGTLTPRTLTAESTRRDTDAAFERLLSIGHTSGLATALGLLAIAEKALSNQPGPYATPATCA